MRSISKIAISLLISILIFTVFEILAFSGLFSYFETKFFHKRVIENIYHSLETKTNVINKFNNEYLTRFSEIAQNDTFWRNYLSNKSANVIKTTNDIVSSLKSSYSGFLGLRLIDTRGNIHFSTFSDDIKIQKTYEIVYKRINDTELKNTWIIILF